jgi:hypothetical protein
VRGLIAAAGGWCPLRCGDSDSEILDQMVCPPNSSSERKTEAAILEMKDGRLLLAYTDFYTASPLDDAPAQIKGRYSSDMGRTWTPSFLIVKNTAQMNVMSVSLLRLQSGEIAMTYMHKESHEDCAILFRISRDEAKTFGNSVRLSAHRSFWVMNNDRLVQLRSGRLLAPCQRLDNWPMVRHSLTHVLYSDDNGTTWHSSEAVDIRDNGDGADEPGVIELNDGRILMYFRTALGSIYQCFSSDRGVSWSKPESTKLEAPVSPAIIKRIPSTGDLLLVWNHTLPHGRGGHSDRFPLTAAISRNDGASWENIRDFDTDERYTFGYPSITFCKDRALVTYWAARDWPWWVGLKVKSVPVRWFYESAATL